MRIGLQFLPEHCCIRRARLEYAFRVFCAIYGHEPVTDMGESADVYLAYSAGTNASTGRPRLAVSSLYQVRKLDEPAPSPHRFAAGSEETVLFWPPSEGRQPDWLGEIFEWISCADEYAVQARDYVGRIPFKDSYAGRHGLDASRPYAAIAMHLLQRAICAVLPRAISRPCPPVAGFQQLIVNTHDVDYLPTSRYANVVRLTKNSGVSLLLHKRPGLAIKQLARAARAAVGAENSLDQLLRLAAKEEEHGIKGSYYFIPAQRHRRDANYRIEHPRAIAGMRELERRGMEIGVHGSYTSLDCDTQLESEFRTLESLGFAPRGGRQHWLRFTLPGLIRATERVGSDYDASLGWSERIGFRAGACFAFPPYNFDEERASSFLEIPLAVMEGSLMDQGLREEEWYAAVSQLLETSRRYGWGGISILWHPTAFGGSQLPQAADDLFWELVKSTTHNGDGWMTGAGFFQQVQQRYKDAGLLCAAGHLASEAVPS